MGQPSALTLPTEPSMSVKELKEQLSRHFALEEKLIQLAIKDGILHEESTLGEAGIGDGETIMLAIDQREGARDRLNGAKRPSPLTLPSPQQTAPLVSIWHPWSKNRMRTKLTR